MDDTFTNPELAFLISGVAILIAFDPGYVMRMAIGIAYFAYASMALYMTITDD